MARLSGTWTLRATALNAGWDQRLLITGSTTADGAYPMLVGTVVAGITGVEVDVRPQAFNPVVGHWVDSLQRESMSWDPVAGVVVTISADDQTDAPDLDYDDLVVVCTTSDPELVPPPLEGPPLDLTVPEHYVSKTSDSQKPNEKPGASQ